MRNSRSGACTNHQTMCQSAAQACTLPYGNTHVVDTSKHLVRGKTEQAGVLLGTLHGEGFSRGSLPVRENCAIEAAHDRLH